MVARNDIARAGRRTADLILRIGHVNAVTVGDNRQSIRAHSNVIAEDLIAGGNIGESDSDVSVAADDVSRSRSQAADSVAITRVSRDAGVVAENIGARGIGADEVAFDHSVIREFHQQS